MKKLHEQQKSKTKKNNELNKVEHKLNKIIPSWIKFSEEKLERRKSVTQEKYRRKSFHTQLKKTLNLKEKRSNHRSSLSCADADYTPLALLKEKHQSISQKLINDLKISHGVVSPMKINNKNKNRISPNCLNQDSHNQKTLLILDRVKKLSFARPNFHNLKIIKPETSPKEEGIPFTKRYRDLSLNEIFQIEHDTLDNRMKKVFKNMEERSSFLE